MGRVKDFAKKHKKAIIITTSVVGVLLVGGTAIYLNKGKLSELLSDSSLIELSASVKTSDIETIADAVCGNNSIDETSIRGIRILNNGEPFPVKGHIRNLSAGKKASIEKIEAALRNGIDLEECQTYVDSYMKNCA